MIWTKCPMKLSLFSDRSTVTIPDKASSRSWYFTEHEMDPNYVSLLHRLKVEFVILIGKLGEAVNENWLASTFKNGVALQYPFVEGDRHTPDDPQIHVYPLVLIPWYQKKYRAENPETDPLLFVDGKPVHWTKDVCFNCNMMLDRSMKQCSAFHESCLKSLVSAKQLPTEEWLDAHRTDTAAMEQSDYRPIKKIMVAEAFEPFSIYNITLDKKVAEAMREKRSAAAITASSSRFIKKVSCPKCMISGNCVGYRGGGSWCRGPLLPEDYDYLYNNCEPWMVHTLLLTKDSKLQPEVVEAWRRMKSTIYVLAPKCGKPAMDLNWTDRYTDDNRCVRLMRNCYGNHTVSMPYLHLCKVLKVPSVRKWAELPELYAQSKAMRSVAYGLASGRIRSTEQVVSGFGSHGITLMGVKLCADGGVSLLYNNSRHTFHRRYALSNAAFNEEIVRFPGLMHESGASFTIGRTLQIRVFQAAVNNRRLNITPEEVKTAIEQFKYDRDNFSEDQMYQWLEERSKERCRQKRRSSKPPVSSPTGEPATAT